MCAEYFFEGSPLKWERENTKICLILDFDGTLVPIQNDPEGCILSPEVKNQLAALAALDSCSVAVLSGRSLPDIQKKVNVDGVYHGGNHGLLISGPGVSFVHPDVLESIHLVEDARNRLEKEVSAIEGVWIEDKEFGLTVHYRQAPGGAAAAVRKMVDHTLSGIPERKGLTVLKGKKVLEVAPNVAWDKGKAAFLILGTLGGRPLPVYVGDDLTDEYAFRALEGKGVTVRVGPSKKTRAKYYLKGQWEIERLLEEVSLAAGVRPPGPERGRVPLRRGR